MQHHNSNRAVKAQLITPSIEAISAHIYALFAPDFVHGHPDSWIEIAYARPGSPLNKGRVFSAHDPKPIIEFVKNVNLAGFNVYVGAALRRGNHPSSGRANKSHYAASRFAWIEYDAAGDHERVVSICKTKNLKPALMVVTGTIPSKRCHLYFQIGSPIANPEELKETNSALKELFGSDHVDDPARVLRVAGSVNYASPAKAARGYIDEITKLHINTRATSYSVQALRELAQDTSDLAAFAAYAKSHLAKFGKSTDELLALLEASRAPHSWWNNIRSATASMVGKGWPEQAVLFACAPYAAGGIYDKDVQKLYDDAFAKFGKEA